MRIAALLIGRGGSSLRDKNLLPVKGVPLLLWTAAAARQSHRTQEFYVSSDDPRILETAGRAGYQAIRRPDDLASGSARSCDVVRHALGEIPDAGTLDVLVVVHANIPSITGEMIDECIETLLADPSATSVVPVHRSTGTHPLWAKLVSEEGRLIQAAPGDHSPNRQELPAAFFPDHSFWVLRTSAITADGGQPPWPCMGNQIVPFVTEGPVDVHVAEDLRAVEEWLDRNGVPAPHY